jgi:hypothetical protein
MSKMAEIEEAMDEVLSPEPELTFREVAAELVKKGTLEFALLEDPYLHATLYGVYAKCKVRAGMDRANKDI